MKQTRYVLNKKDGRLLIWNVEIASNSDYVEITTKEAQEIIGGANFANVLRRKFQVEREEELDVYRAAREPEGDDTEGEEEPDVLVYKGTPMPPAEPPVKFSVKEIMREVGTDPAKAELALADEETQAKPRKSLIRDLKAIINAYSEEVEDDEEEAEGDAEEESAEEIDELLDKA